MNSLRNRRPTNLNLIVANPDSDEDSDSSNDGKKANQPSLAAGNKAFGAGHAGNSSPGVTITAQPPTPGTLLQQTPQAVQNPGGRRVSNDQSPHSIQTTSTIEIPNHPFSAAGEKARSASAENLAAQGYSSPEISHRPVSGGSTFQAGKSAALGGMPVPVPSGPVPIQDGFSVITAPNARQGRTTTPERSLPRIHTPPTYPIPLPPSSATITARPQVGSSIPPPTNAPHPSYNAFYNQKIPTNGQPSPVQSSSPSSPSLSYGASAFSNSNSAGFNSNSNPNEMPRRRHDLPMLPPRPKQLQNNNQASTTSSQLQNSSSSVPPVAATPVTATGAKLGNIRLAVTVDNENFSVVDVAGMASAEAIMERVFAKVSGSSTCRFRRN